MLLRGGIGADDCCAQELGLSNYSSESKDATSKTSSDGQQYHALFNAFYKLVYEHIASLVEVSPQHWGCCLMPA